MNTLKNTLCAFKGNLLTRDKLLSATKLLLVLWPVIAIAEESSILDTVTVSTFNMKYNPQDLC